jgi:transcription initiation factor IIE alpha subunit
MKLFSVIYILSLLLIFSCSDKNKDSANSTPAPTSINSTGAVEHYTCPNGHAGSGGAEAGTCSQCGATLEHNAAFHNDPPPTDPAAAETTAGINSDVEHYICPNGHVGSGGAAAGTCSQCGATLEHNAAYHNDPPPSDLTDLNTPPPSTPQNAPATSNSGVEHYTCPTGHAGKGGAAEGSCSQCGAALVHNAAFHANEGVQNVITDPTVNNAPASAPVITPQPSEAVSPIFRNNPTFPGGNVPAPATAGGGTEPAQNSRGVWHYTCPKGCSGGAGSDVACANCGATLVHNTAYHN